MRSAIALPIVLAFAAPSLAQTRTSKTLDIYILDVEGGTTRRCSFRLPASRCSSIPGMLGRRPLATPAGLWRRSRTPEFARSIT